MFEKGMILFYSDVNLNYLIFDVKVEDILNNLGKMEEITFVCMFACPSAWSLDQIKRYALSWIDNKAHISNNFSAHCYSERLMLQDKRFEIVGNIFK